MVTEGILNEGYTANYLAFDVIGSFSFGKPFGFIQKGYDAYGLIQTIDERGEVFNALGSVPSFLRPFMKYYRFDPFWKGGAKAKANFEDFCRRAYLEENTETPATVEISYRIYSRLKIPILEHLCRRKK
jgi:benzoate 4-monooxygenase